MVLSTYHLNETFSVELRYSANSSKSFSGCYRTNLSCDFFSFWPMLKEEGLNRQIRGLDFPPPPIKIGNIIKRCPYHRGIRQKSFNYPKIQRYQWVCRSLFSLRSRCLIFSSCETFQGHLLASCLFKALRSMNCSMNYYSSKIPFVLQLLLFLYTQTDKISYLPDRDKKISSETQLRYCQFRKHLKLLRKALFCVEKFRKVSFIFLLLYKV